MQHWELGLHAFWWRCWYVLFRRWHGNKQYINFMMYSWLIVFGDNNLHLPNFLICDFKYLRERDKFLFNRAANKKFEKKILMEYITIFYCITISNFYFYLFYKNWKWQKYQDRFFLIHIVFICYAMFPVQSCGVYFTINHMLKCYWSF